ncbi:hypothetical protein [Paenibacillus sp. NPDC057967]|uniref:hypothetical protein n=1 Tax=Paenibacillus sp. NPDC057967 TaxID=3346293 RepID=UPI0036D89238
MNKSVQTSIQHLKSTDRSLQTKAFLDLQFQTEEVVDWAYDVWDDLVSDLSHSDNHCRAIAAQLLSNLAKSDPEKRILQDFPKLLAVTWDKRFVTARHTLQSLWKIGIAGDTQKDMVLDALADRYRNCADEKNGTLIRYDILVGFRQLYDWVDDEKIREGSLNLIKLELDPKYRKKYAAVWKK